MNAGSTVKFWYFQCLIFMLCFLLCCKNIVRVKLGHAMALELAG